MKSEKVKALIKSKYGSMRAFSEATGIANTTLHDSLRDDVRFEKMPISNFIAIAHALDLSADELLSRVEYYYVNLEPEK